MNLHPSGGDEAEFKRVAPGFISAGVLSLEDYQCFPQSIHEVSDPLLHGNVIMFGKFILGLLLEKRVLTADESESLVRIRTRFSEVRISCSGTMDDVAKMYGNMEKMISTVLKDEAPVVKLIPAPAPEYDRVRSVPVRTSRGFTRGKLAALGIAALGIVGGIKAISSNNTETAEVSTESSKIDESQVKVGDIIDFESFDDAVKRGYLIIQDGQMVPKDGYDWAHPENPESFSVKRVK